MWTSIAAPGHIAEQDAERGFGHAAFGFVGVQKPLPIFGRFWRKAGEGEPGEKRAPHAEGVDHPVLGDRRVDVDAANDDGRQVGRKGLHVDLARGRSVEGIADDRGEL
jgi:hypothetical protein